MYYCKNAPVFAIVIYKSNVPIIKMYVAHDNFYSLNVVQSSQKDVTSVLYHI